MARTIKRDELNNVIRQAQSGSHDALRLLIEEYRDRVIRVLTDMLKDEELAKDCYQEACQKLFVHIKSFNFEHQFSTWFYTINLNLARNHLRTRKRFPEESIDNHAELPTRTVWDPLASRKTEIIHAAIAALPKKYREAYALRDLHNWMYEDIANLLNIPLGTAKSRINRGRLLVKAYILNNHPELLRRSHVL